MNWISVKDRLPEENELVIVSGCTDELHYFVTSAFRKIYSNKSFVWFENNLTEDDDWMYEREVSHWMPFPVNFYHQTERMIEKDSSEGLQ